MPHGPGHRPGQWPARSGSLCAPHGGPGERMFRVQPSVTEVGGEVGPGGVTLPGLLPRHCLIHHTEGAVTVTPCAHAEVSNILL